MTGGRAAACHEAAGPCRFTLNSAFRRYSPPVVTDPVPRSARVRQQYEASDARHTLELPPAEPLQQDSERLRAALEAAQAPGYAARPGAVDHLAGFYRVPAPRPQDPGRAAAPGS